ncbi:Uncharacterised protein [Vibrio cholerae]|nr:Uncharacterised protein [Vibrio cholerae]
MHLTQHAIAGICGIHHNPKRVNIHNGVKALLFGFHLVVDGEQVFLTTHHASRQPHFL